MGPEATLRTLPERTTNVTASRWLPLIGGAMVVLAAVIASLGVVHDDRSAVMLPIAIAGGVGLLFLGYTRFVYFVVALLVLRASLDVAKFGNGSIDATGAASVLFILVALVWLFIQRAQEGAEEPNPVAAVLPPLIAVFITGLVSVTASTHPLISATEAIRIGTLAVIVAVMGRLALDERNANLLLGAVFASAIIPLAAGVSQLIRAGGWSFGGFSRVRGTFVHPNPFSAYLFLIITLGVAVIPHLRWKWKLPVGVITAGSAVALIATYTRGSWVGLLVALIVIGILQDRRIFLVLVAGVVAVVLFVPSVSTRLSDLSTQEKASGATGNSLIWRFEYWQQVLELQRNPFVGVGLKEVEQTQSAAKQPHNDVIRVYVETGLFGLLAYVWLVITLAIQAARAVRRAPPGLPRGLAVAFAASLAGLVLMSLAANVISQLVILWYFAAILTLAIVAARRNPEPIAA